jgi:hypothetical protein
MKCEHRHGCLGILRFIPSYKTSISPAPNRIQSKSKSSISLYFKPYAAALLKPRPTPCRPLLKPTRTLTHNQTDLELRQVLLQYRQTYFNAHSQVALGGLVQHHRFYQLETDEPPIRNPQETASGNITAPNKLRKRICHYQNILRLNHWPCFHP